MDKKLTKTDDVRLKNLSRAGRPAGIPNRSTTLAREAIAGFVDANAHKMQEWLEKVANGVKTDDGKWVVPPSPDKAFTMLQQVMEYHLPKLARQEVVGDETKPIHYRFSWKK